MTKPNKVLRVAFTGPAGSGKTTHARLLQKAYGGDVLSFATPLKKTCSNLWGASLDDEEFSRRAHQEIGVAVRHVDVQTWVRLLIAKVPSNRNCFVDDLRFANEAAALRSRGFLIIRLVASDSVLAERRPHMTAEQRRHQSETESLFITNDTVFATDGDVDDVQADIRTFVLTHESPLLKEPLDYVAAEAAG